METIHTHGHDMLVTHRDGNPLPPAARFWVDTLTIGTAERYDVVIEANNPGLWMMHTHIDHHATNDHMAPGGAMGMIIYRDVEAEQGSMHPFAQGAELPGGLPWVEPLTIPADVSKETSISVQGTGPLRATPVDGSLGFPVSMPCAVRTTILTGQWTGTLPHEVSAPEGITVSIRDGDDRAMLDEPAAFGDDGTFRLDLSPLDKNNQVVWKPGNYTAELGGTVVGSGTVELQAFVDYVEEEQQLYSGRNLSGTACDPADRVFDPIEYARQTGAI